MTDEYELMNNDEFLLQSSSNCILIDKKTNEPVLYIPQANFSQIAIDKNYVAAKGGRQQFPRIIGWDYSGDGSFIVTSSSFSLAFLEVAAGGLKRIEEDFYYNMETYTPQGYDNPKKLEREQIDEDSIKVYWLNSSGKQISGICNDYSFDPYENELTIDNPILGHDVLVFYQNKANIESLYFGNFKKDNVYSLVGNFEIYNENTSEKEILFFEFPKIQILHTLDLRILNSDNPDQVYGIKCQAFVDTQKGVILKLMRRVEGY